MARLRIGALSTGLLFLVSCAEKPARLAEPVWMAQSPLAAAAGLPTSWPDAAWLTGSPESAGIPAARLMEAAATTERDLPQVRALLVVVDGRLVFERYFRGAEPQAPIAVKSVTKSIVSALVGIALARGELSSLDTPIVRWLGPEQDAIIDPRVSAVTLRHALSMTAGFEWQENGPTTREWLGSENQVRYMLGAPMAAAPGETFNYNSGLAHLVGVVLARATGLDLATYADRRLFERIGIRRGAWGRDRQGYHEGGSELELTPRDLARFGLLYLNRGRWRGEQVVPEAWVMESTRPHGRVDYGYLWWYLPQEWGGPALNALGYGGQLISIVPDANAVIVVGSTIADPDNPVLTILRERLLPAVRARATKAAQRD
jgi:CubicO group peptidase (beta-lactamase class C family)